MDVYSFRVVLMQLITGKKSLDETMPYESCQLATWLRRVPVTKENMVKYVDKALNTNDNETLESIFKVAELAKHCTTVEPFHRPEMGYVGNVLRPLFERWKPLGLLENLVHLRDQFTPGNGFGGMEYTPIWSLNPLTQLWLCIDQGTA